MQDLARKLQKELNYEPTQKRPKIAILYKKYNVEISQLLQQGNTTNQVASYLAKRDNISYTAIYFRALKINKDLKRDNNL